MADCIDGVNTMNSEQRRPTRAELIELGRDIAKAMSPLRRAHPELSYVIAYGLPREGEPDKLAASTVSNIDSPRVMVELLVHGAMEVKTQLIDPFQIELKPDS